MASRVGAVGCIGVALVLAGCLETRTGAFRCQPGDVCDIGLSCIDGWCVSGDSGGGDGGLSCPSVCTSCDGATCSIVCDTGLACRDVIVCPDGFDCVVECSGGGSCEGGIDCSASGACDIDCAANGSCEGPITCAGGACSIACAGTPSCSGGIDCSAACACDTSCTGGGACSMLTQCRPPGSCTDGNDDCTSDGAGACDEC